MISVNTVGYKRHVGYFREPGVKDLWFQTILLIQMNIHHMNNFVYKTYQEFTKYRPMNASNNQDKISR